MNHDRISLLKNFIEEEPDNPFNRYALAMEYYDYVPKESLRLLASLISDVPGYLPSYFKAAHLYWENEQSEQAEATFTEGIALARQLNDSKALSELTSAYQNFQFEKD